MDRLKIYSVLFISVLFLGCTTQLLDNAVEQPNGRELVLIYGFISPEEDEVKVSVSSTRSIFDPTVNFDLGLIDDLIITDAMVSIENEAGEEIQLPFDSDANRYIVPASQFAIEPGMTYSLRVSAQGKEFTASCRVPLERVSEIRSFGELVPSDSFTRVDNFGIRFTDVVGENNFYVVGASFVESLDGLRSVIDFDSERYVTDVNGDGIDIVVSSIGSFFYNNENGNTVALTTQIANVDGLIHDTFRADFINREANDSDPFFRAVVPPSNIDGDDGGYGVFAGFRLTEQTEGINNP